MQPKNKHNKQAKKPFAKSAFDCAVYYSEKHRFWKPEIDKTSLKLATQSYNVVYSF